MKKGTLKNLTQAHGWLGMIISGLLFLIFFAGAISLFRQEIYQWSVQPTHTPVVGPMLSVTEIIPIATEGRNFNPKEHLSIIPPSHELPYYKVYVDIINQEGEESLDKLLIDPVSGKIVAHIDSYFLADFIYLLHYRLNIPYGGYILGIVTLFFFFLLLSGAVIHAKKLVNNFFQYRTDKNKRSQMLDMHNVVGSISLPFTLMYALTGLIFNLVIIYQISFALVLYKGDQTALLADAGYHDPHPPWTDKAQNFDNIERLLQQVTDEYQQGPYVVRLYNHGDESAVLHFIGKVPGYLSQRYETAIRLKDESVIFKTDMHQNNKFRQGLNFMSELHFGGYAGLDLRFIYFLLSIGVCALIITGNLLWLEKREKKHQQYQLSSNLLGHMTLISTLGLTLATSAAFVAERWLPATLVSREDWMVYTFVLTLALSALLSPLFSRNKLMPLLLNASAILLVFVVFSDWWLHGENLRLLWQQGHITAFAVEVGIMLMAIICALTARYLKTRASTSQQQTAAHALAEQL